MVKESENETEILLGNKQLLAIFFVAAVLLGLAFTGGYMYGYGSGKKATIGAASSHSNSVESPAAPVTAGAETHSVGAESSSGDDTETAERSRETAKRSLRSAGKHESANTSSTIRTTNDSKRTSSATEPSRTPIASDENFAPKSGQTFLQVAAVGQDEADAVAEVLRKKGFRAHATPKPGSPKLYRVLIGPIRDTGDLSTTRDSLRHTGFREVIVQRY